MARTKTTHGQPDKAPGAVDVPHLQGLAFRPGMRAVRWDARTPVRSGDRALQRPGASD